MAIEDLTTYTEVDPNNRITVTSARSSFADLTNDEDAYVYKDKGVAHFNGDFEHLIDIHLTSGIGWSPAICWALANMVDDRNGVYYAGQPELMVQLEPHTGAAIRLQELYQSNFYVDEYEGSLDTTYYLKIKRDEAVGTYGTLYCYIYSDAARTNLVDTLSVTLHEKTDYRYIYATQTVNENDGKEITGYCENLDLQEAPPGFPHSTGSIIG